MYLLSFCWFYYDYLIRQGKSPSQRFDDSILNTYLFDHQSDFIKNIFNDTQLMIIKNKIKNIKNMALYHSYISSLNPIPFNKFKPELLSKNSLLMIK